MSNLESHGKSDELPDARHGRPADEAAEDINALEAMSSGAWVEEEDDASIDPYFSEDDLE